LQFAYGEKEIFMAQFFDLHSHMLCGVDDGAKTVEEMSSMLEMAYEDGIRAICLTPHYSPYLFGDTFEKSAESFEILKKYVSEKHPDMRIFIGHELGYHRSGLDALNDGVCRSIAGSRYVQVDFAEAIEFFEIQSAMDQLQRAGYFPILAHTERYRSLFRQIKWIEEFVENGGIVQLNASSVTGSWGRGAQKQWKKLIRRGLAHIIASDGHNLTSRPPLISVCMPFLQKHCDAHTIRALTWDNPCRVVRDELI
jgi:protein-tyrosine phosphatase